MIRLLADRLLGIGLLAALIVPGFSPASRTALAAIPDEQRIEVIIHDYLFEQVHRTPPKVGGDTIIILRNQDIVRHGFTSSALPQLYLRVEGEGVSAYGKGLEGLYIEPGKTLVVRLVLERSGRLTFHCDLHPEMTGEMFLLDVPAV